MRRLTAFEQVSVDGFFTGARGDMSWAHKQDPEWNDNGNVVLWDEPAS
jgi:hypothetical protein